MPAPLTAALINERNRAFWEIENARMLERMGDDAVRQTALEAMAAETNKGTPVYFQTSICQALADAEKAKRRFSRQQAQKGGRAEKSDELQTLIQKFVRHLPNLTFAQLLEKLEECKKIRDVIDEIDDGVIYFKQGPTGKSAPISGLKDRLSRAKKKIKIAQSS
jgi:uncharacterized protein YihD (DUF1040 family)